MIGKGMLILLLVVGVVVAGCATTKTFMLKNDKTVTAKKVIEETEWSYVIEEEKSGDRLVIHKNNVISVK